MQTLQAVLKAADTAELVAALKRRFPVDLAELPAELTVAAAQAHVDQVWRDYLDRLRTLEIQPAADGQTWVLYVYHELKDGMPEPSVNVTPLAELQREGVAAPSYALEWTSQAELLGYYVAENRLTKYYQTDLLVEVLADACFFGLKQEHLAEEIASLTARTQAPGKTFSEEAVKRELGWDEEAGDTFTPQEEKYRAQAEAAAQKISDYSKQAAIDKILQSLAD